MPKTSAVLHRCTLRRSKNTRTLSSCSASTAATNNSSSFGARSKGEEAIRGFKLRLEPVCATPFSCKVHHLCTYCYSHEHAVRQSLSAFLILASVRGPPL